MLTVSVERAVFFDNHYLHQSKYRTSKCDFFSLPESGGYDCAVIATMHVMWRRNEIFVEAMRVSRKQLFSEAFCFDSTIHRVLKQDFVVERLLARYR